MINHEIINPDAAAHVLWHLDGPLHGGLEPGNFTRCLLQAMGAADVSNFRLLAVAFPDYAAAWALFMDAPTHASGRVALQALTHQAPAHSAGGNQREETP